MRKIPVGILGATGMVGQYYVSMLAEHPYFEIAFLAASHQSSGKAYKEAVRGKWHLGKPIPERCRDLPVFSVDEIDQGVRRCRLVFSALGGDGSKNYEELYAKAGCAVVSNASTHRMDPDVPLLLPEVNGDHLKIIDFQKRARNYNGFIVVKPNCSVQSYLVPLAPLHQKFGLKRLIVTTLQAVSGAGFPGVSSLSISDNIVPYIPHEEEKLEREPLKILGSLSDQGIKDATGIVIAAHCNRVPVIDGHMACISVEFSRKPSREEILETWRDFQGLPQQLSLPTAPQIPILYREEEDRPQPRLDRDAGGGMTITVGRLRECPLLQWRFVGLSHNVIRGAAGGGLLNGELLYAQNYLEKL